MNMRVGSDGLRLVPGMLTAGPCVGDDLDDERGEFRDIANPVHRRLQGIHDFHRMPR